VQNIAQIDEIKRKRTYFELFSGQIPASVKFFRNFLRNFFGILAF